MRAGKRVIRNLMKNDTAVRVAMFMTRLGELCMRERNTPPGDVTLTVEEAVRQLNPELVVRRGPFKGMRYLEAQQVLSLLPKLIGSYEREIGELIETFCNTSYSSIVDVGCAEGYYAIGFAMRRQDALVFAYDTNPHALELCREMALLNRVVDRVITGSSLSGETLQSLPLGSRALIISDCEGYEKELFRGEVVLSIAAHDVLIEVHDRFDGTISEMLIDRFRPTHEIEIFRSMDDWRKAKLYNYEELSELNLATRMTVLAEARGSPMEWFYCKSRASLNIGLDYPLAYSASAVG
jgi:hypothetical protein